MSIVWYFAALVVLIALSAFFSASEMSYSSANRLRLENAAEDGDRRAKTAVGILDHFDRTLSAILIGNNLVNIAASSLGSVIVILLAGEQWTWVSTVVLTLLVIIFGETMPKIVAKQNANGIALRNAYIIRALSVILYPVIWLVVGLVHLITRPLHGDAGDGDPEEAASQELQSIIETAEDEDVLDEDRSELLRSALDFSDVSASEAMTARVDMVAIDIDDDWDEIVRIIRASQTPDAAKQTMIERFELSDIQASAIIEMRLRALTGLERGKLLAERDEREGRVASGDEQVDAAVVEDAEHTLGFLGGYGVVEGREEILDQKADAHEQGGGEADATAVRHRAHDEQHERGDGKKRSDAVAHGVGDLLAKGVAAPIGA